MLIDHEHPQTTLTDELLGVVDALLQTNSTVSINCIRRALRFSDPRLAIHLFPKCTPRILQCLILHHSILRDIVEKFEEQYATSTIQMISREFHELSTHLFSGQFFEAITDALDVATDRGFVELVEILFSYILSPGSIIQKIILKGNHAMMEFILRFGQRLHKGIEDIDLLIIALELGDLNRAHSLEEKGAIIRLQNDHNIGQALTAALGRGNLKLATMVLSLDPDFDFVDHRDFSLEAAFDAALTHNFDDIAWKLLFSRQPRLQYTTGFRDLENGYLLSCSVTNRKPDFVKAIIGRSIDLDDDLYYDNANTLKAIMEWGNDSVLNEIWQAHNYGIFHLKPEFFYVALKGEHLGLFWKFLYPTSDDWEVNAAYGLQAVAECENVPVIDELIALGAQLMSIDQLTMCITGHPSMAEPLLKRFWDVYQEEITEGNLYFLKDAIRYYPEEPKWLDMLFEFELVPTDVARIPGGHSLLRIAMEQFRQIKPVADAVTFVKRFIDVSNVNAIVRFDSELYSALLLAITLTHVEIVQLLIDHHADVNIPTGFGIQRTPLQKAAESNNLAMVSLLLVNKADVNAPPARFNGATALQFAAIHGNCEMAMMLIEHGAQLNIPPPEGRHGRWPLEGAAENGRLDMIKFLWEANGGPFDDEQCRKAMRLAAREGHLGCRDLIKELLGSAPSIE